MTEANGESQSIPAETSSGQGGDLEGKEEEIDEDEDTLLGFARIYSGTIRVGSKVLCVLPKYNNNLPPNHPLNIGHTTATIDFYSPAQTGDVLLWTSPVLPTGTHTFTLRVTGTSDPASSGRQIAVDDADITGPAPPYVEVDDTVQGAGTDQFNYVGGGWGHASGEGARRTPTTAPTATT